MKTYHGKRTERGCEVTVDGKPLQMQSNLSGNATTAFDWGYVGIGQLSVALLADLLGNEDAAGAASMVSEGGPVVGSGDIQKSPDGGAASDGGHVVNKSLDEAVNAADAALRLVKEAHQADHADDGPADEAMSTTNRAADHKAYKAIRAADEAVALARTSMDDAKRVVAKPLPKIAREGIRKVSETKGD